MLGCSADLELELGLKRQRKNEGPWAEGETWLRARRGEYTLHYSMFEVCDVK